MDLHSTGGYPTRPAGFFSDAGCAEREDRLSDGNFPLLLRQDRLHHFLSFRFKSKIVDPESTMTLKSCSLYLIGLALTAWMMPPAAAAEEMLGDGNDGNRSGPVHVIEIFDEQGNQIKPSDAKMNPISLSQTCGKCHTMETISRGWHFQAALNGPLVGGRVGEPLVLADSETRTQIPVSDRGWSGTYSAKQLGITPWQFVQYFGSHLPGGGYGTADAPEEDPVAVLRSGVSGKYEINCLACHNIDDRQDQSDGALQAARQNYRWISTVASGLAIVKGTASELDDLYDPWTEDKLKCLYEKSRFNSEDKVFFDISRKPSANRCYFCHSTQEIDTMGPKEWIRDQDVHLAAGLTCADCHRNGADHMISRGDQIAAGNGMGEVSTLSCQGCHLGDETADAPAARQGGRLGAPYPLHAGIPTIHFKSLTCTACHSGPMPESDAKLVRTARVHKLGLHGKHAVTMKLPHVQWPIMVRGEDDRIAPSKLMWPAFWATLKDGKLNPFTPKALKEVIGDMLKSSEEKVNDWLPLDHETIAEVLKTLSEQMDQPAEGVKPEAVYVAGGKMYRMSGEQVVSEEDPMAGPYSWPIAHDVRPASQSLGRNGHCGDCHSTKASFFFGNVAVSSPVKGVEDVRKMVSFQKVSPKLAWAFAFSFVFRPYMKITVILCCAVIAAVLLTYVLKALGWFSHQAAEED